MKIFSLRFNNGPTVFVTCQNHEMVEKKEREMEVAAGEITHTHTHSTRENRKTTIGDGQSESYEEKQKNDQKALHRGW